MGVIDEVKQKTDIVEVVSRYTSLKKSGKTFTALCPFHSEKHPSFFVYPERQSWHCFGACNTGGDVLAFVMKKEAIEFGDALRLLAERAGVTIPSRIERGAKGEEKERLYQVNAAAAQYFNNLLLNSPSAKRARDYLESRGLLKKTISDFQLGFSLNSRQALKEHLAERGYREPELAAAGLIIEVEAGKKYDRFRNKLMFPISNIRGRITGFGARVLDESLPKYVNSPQTLIFDKSANLYGINLATTAIREQNGAVIMEGYLDVITAHQNGFSNVVASMGTSLTEKQVSSLKKLTRNVSLALDADAAGEEATLRAISYENTLNAEVKVIILPEGKDPDDVIREDSQAWQGLVAGALPIIDYTFNKVTAELDLSTAKGKSQAADRLLPIIAGIKDIVRQAHYLQKLAQLVRVSERSLEATMSRMRAGQGRGRAKEEATSRVLPPIFASPLEEYCLALLLQHPELKAGDEGLLAEYFENSENRAIFIARQKTGNIASLKKNLDDAIHEHLDFLTTKDLLVSSEAEIRDSLADCILRLRGKFLQGLAAKREEALSLEPPSGLTEAELAKLQEPAREISAKLGEVFTQRSQRK
ncbi:MAG: DNA primase [Dehalococcoidia bacterium]|nr:MAG: DNA primase [Dehalococcoidia bacterium]